MTAKNEGEKAEKKELNLETKVTVRSIDTWPTTWYRRVDVAGQDSGIVIPPKGAMRFSRNEIIAQVQNNNYLFSGIDGSGNHATYYIDDAPTRIELGFDDENGKRQFVLNHDKVRELFAIKSQTEFEKKAKEYIVTRAEKNAVIDMIRELELNDYSKIRYIENYVGRSVM